MIAELILFGVLIHGCPIAPGGDWVPETEDISIVVTEAHTMSLEEWHSVKGLPDEYWLARTGWCEGRFDPTAVNGPHKGSWQVNEEYHGTVPPDLRGQAEQASRIEPEQGREPWETKDGCNGWR